MVDYDLLALGGLYPKGHEEEVLRKTVYGLQFASNAHLWNIINGLDSVLDRPVSILNMLPVGSYPKRYRDMYIKEYAFSHAEGARDLNAGYLNITVVKKLSRMLAVRKHIKRWLKKDDGKKKVLIIYAVVSEYLAAAKMIKKLHHKVHVCLIVPDLPAFTDVDKSQGVILNKMAEYKTNNAFRKIKYIDSFVLLTESMHDYFGITKPYIVIEGITDGALRNVHEIESDELKTIVYTGTLAKKFGIMELLNAFSKLDGEKFRLAICGDGEARQDILRYAESDDRIRFLGAVSREEALKVQREATLLVNPRRGDEDFTKYSFPSKLIEYMAAARPVICFKLPGIPAEYDDYLCYFEGETPDKMAESMKRILNKSRSELDDIGKKNYKFVSENKNVHIQAQKIIDMISKAEG
ncbi:MAG: glycosyltransferase [Bacillota bacterium]|nr:glycosyltransferase [Bacillota bacterium]